ncbi:hypothetical protein DYB32_001193 [Aphanomyces invadans]|uniref:Uncharacterized protein n=1 Tax=Aphanomyces invadans TaxID=157072 RepID=A0A3R6YF88_9STRA|nr:hypothetical protein DYB32_001193 [Aphanomyces invadans]
MAEGAMSGNAAAAATAAALEDVVSAVVDGATADVVEVIDLTDDNEDAIAAETSAAIVGTWTFAAPNWIEKEERRTAAHRQAARAMVDMAAEELGVEELERLAAKEAADKAAHEAAEAAARVQAAKEALRQAEAAAGLVAAGQRAAAEASRRVVSEIEAAVDGVEDGEEDWVPGVPMTPMQVFGSRPVAERDLVWTARSDLWLSSARSIAGVTRADAARVTGRMARLRNLADYAPLDADRVSAYLEMFRCGGHEDLEWHILWMLRRRAGQIDALLASTGRQRIDWAPARQFDDRDWEEGRSSAWAPAPASRKTARRFEAQEDPYAGYYPAPAPPPNFVDQVEDDEEEEEEPRDASERLPSLHRSW